MKIRTVTAALAAFPLALAALAVAPSEDCRSVDVRGTPEDAGDDIDLCRTETWFHGPDEKVTNLKTVGLAGEPTFTDQAPASVTTGAGSGIITSSDLGSEGSVTFAGTYEGHIDNIGATVFLFTAGDDIYGAHGALITLEVDGTVVYQTTESWDEIPLTSGGNAVKRMDFAFTGLLPTLGYTLPSHEVELTIAALTGGDDSVYVWGASEAASGLTFNLTATDLFAYTVLG